MTISHIIFLAGVLVFFVSAPVQSQSASMPCAVTQTGSPQVFSLTVIQSFRLAGPVGTICSLSVRVTLDKGNNWLTPPSESLSGNASRFPRVTIARPDQELTVTWAYLGQVQTIDQAFFAIEISVTPIEQPRKQEEPQASTAASPNGAVATLGGGAFMSFLTKRTDVNAEPRPMGVWGRIGFLKGRALEGRIEIHFVTDQISYSNNIFPTSTTTYNSGKDALVLFSLVKPFRSSNGFEFRLAAGGGLNIGNFDPTDGDPTDFSSPVLSAAVELAAPLASFLSVTAGVQPVWRANDIAGLNRVWLRGLAGVELHIPR